MSRGTKLVLDIAFGAIIPVLVLSYLTPVEGQPPRFGFVTTPVAYLIAALIPVAWVALDLLVLTRKFNVITSYIGLAAIINGVLAFWFVDGVRYAVKDSLSLFVTTAIFAGSALVGKPMFQYLFAQGLSPETPEQERHLSGLFIEPPVHRALIIATWLNVAVNIVLGIVNTALNLWIVTAAFGTTAFNTQVAQVNAITRIALTIPSMAAVMGGFYLVYRQIALTALGGTDGSLEGPAFWEALRRRAADQTTPPAHPETRLTEV